VLGASSVHDGYTPAATRVIVLAIAVRPISSSFGIRYEYTRHVISGDECPSHRETATTDTPAEISDAPK